MRRVYPCILLLIIMACAGAVEVQLTPWKAGFTSIEDTIFLREMAFRGELETDKKALSMPADIGEGKYVFTFTSTFIIPDSIDEELYVVTTPSDHPYKVFINGSLVMSEGRIRARGPDYSYLSLRQIICNGCFITDTSRITVEVYPEHLHSGFLNVRIMEKGDATKTTLVHSFFSYTLLTAFSINTFIIAFIFLAFYFASAHHRKDYLYFSFASFAIAGGALNIILSFPNLNELLVWKVARISLLLSPVMVFFFEIHYNDLAKRLKYLQYLFIALTSTFVLALLFQNSRENLETIFKLGIDLVITPSLVLFTLLAIRAVVVKKRFVEWLILFGCTAVFLAAFHDVYHYNKALYPYVWLALYGYIFLEISIVGALVYDMVVLFKHRKEQAVIIECRNEELEHKTRLIKEMSQEKHELLKNMAHEFKTPLQGILATSELLKKNPESALESIEQIMDGLNVQMQKHLFNIENVIDYSLFETDAPEINKGSFDLFNFVDTLKLIFKHNEYNLKSTLQVQIEKKVPRKFFGCERQLRRVILGLISNISKVHGDTISLAIQWNEMSGMLTFSMGSDSGIDEGTLELLNGFEEEGFFVQDASSIEELGVTVARRLVALIGGRILLTPNTIVVSVPVSVVEEVVHEKHSDSAILVVEDNQVNRLLICKIIERLGHKTIIAENGREAIEMVLAHSPELVFMDVQMPIMDGVTATRKIREVLPNGDSPVIVALTANASQQECFDAGVNEFLSKPVTLEQIKGVIDRHYG